MPTYNHGKFAPVAHRNDSPPLPLDDDTLMLIKENPEIETWPGLMPALKAANSEAIQQRNLKLLRDILKHQPKAGELDDVRAFILKKITEKKPETMEHLQAILNR